MYFTAERGARGLCRMMMFDDGCSNFGVYGYADGNVYIMDPHDWSGKHMASRTQEELDDPHPEAQKRTFHC